MALFLVTDGKGMAIVESDDEVLAKCDAMNVAYINEPSELKAIPIDPSSFTHGVMMIRSFEDGALAV